MNFRSISPHDLQTRRVLNGAKLIDVRSTAEYQSGHVPGALSLPMDSLNPSSLANAAGNEYGHSKPIYLTCFQGPRAKQAAETLMSQGFKDVVLLEGGTDAWQKSGLPIRRCVQNMSVMRQVQILIGLLIVSKVVLGFTVHELFFVAAAFVGVSLAVAGIKNWCGLTSLLEKMPWNKSKGCIQSISRPIFNN